MEVEGGEVEAEGRRRKERQIEGEINLTVQSSRIFCNTNFNSMTCMKTCRWCVLNVKGCLGSYHNTYLMTLQRKKILQRKVCAFYARVEISLLRLQDYCTRYTKNHTHSHILLTYLHHLSTPISHYEMHPGSTTVAQCPLSQEHTPGVPRSHSHSPHQSSDSHEGLHPPARQLDIL